MIVNGGQPCNFNYGTFDQASGLFLGGTVYDVTTGTPVYVSGPLPMTDLQNGCYEGGFTPLAGRSYLIIVVQYDDDTYTTVSENRPPEAYNYDAFTSNTALLNFNYGAYDLDANLTISATVYDLTASTQQTIRVTHVANGVYFGQFQGAVGHNYCVVKFASDPTRPPDPESFQAFNISGGSSLTVINTYVEAELTGQSLEATLTGQSLVATLTET